MEGRIKPDVRYVDKSYYFAACGNLLWEIEKLMSSNSLKFDSLVAIAKGGLIVGAYLAFKLEMPLDVVYAQSYKGTEQGELTVMIPDHIALTGKTYLLVDDLYHTGRTLRTVRKKMEPARTIPVVLFRKKETGFFLVDQFAGYTKSWIQFFYEKEVLRV